MCPQSSSITLSLGNLHHMLLEDRVVIGKKLNDSQEIAILLLDGQVIYPKDFLSLWNPSSEPLIHAIETCSLYASYFPHEILTCKTSSNQEFSLIPQVEQFEEHT